MTSKEMRGIRFPAWALLLLRFALPVCVVAASCVAAFGLFRDVSQTATQAASTSTPSLRLGPGAGPTAPLPTPSASPSPSPTHAPLPAAEPTPSAVTTPAPQPLTAPVEIYNASGISGLASRTATALRLRGVYVASIGNLAAAPAPYSGMAVYYWPGIRDQAQALARLSGAGTIAPAPNGLGSAGTLVLVLIDAKSAAVSALISYVP